MESFGPLRLMPCYDPRWRIDSVNRLDQFCSDHTSRIGQEDYWQPVFLAPDDIRANQRV
jgi:hypothetical protein